jgi:hypothetical protein
LLSVTIWRLDFCDLFTVINVSFVTLLKFLLYLRKLPLLHIVHTLPEAHPASSPMGIRDSSLGVKRLGREADHSPPTSAEVKDCGAIHPLPPYAFMA